MSLFDLCRTKMQERKAGIKVDSRGTYCVNFSITELIKMRAGELKMKSQDRLASEKTKMLSDYHIAGMYRFDYLFDNVIRTRKFPMNIEEVVVGGFVDWYTEVDSLAVHSYLQENSESIGANKLSLSEVQLLLGFGNIQLFNSEIKLQNGESKKVGNIMLDSLDQLIEETQTYEDSKNYHKNQKIEESTISRLTCLAETRNYAKPLINYAYEKNMNFYNPFDKDKDPIDNPRVLDYLELTNEPGYECE